jgi:hypothetical protein
MAVINKIMGELILVSGYRLQDTGLWIHPVP